MFRPFSPFVRVCVAALLFASIPVLACSGRAHIEINDSGVYALDYARVIAAQPGLRDCASDDLVLLNRGREVPIRVTGGDRFGPDSRIAWLGEALRGPQSWFDQYSNVNVYQLAAAPGRHARIREAAAAGSGAAAPLQRRLHFEHEELMLRLGDAEMKYGDEPDVWQWAKLTPIDAQPFTFDFDLSDLKSDGRETDVALTLDFRGESNVAGKRAAKPADHVVEVLVNGQLVQTLQWDGRGEIRRGLNVARALLKPQGNRLSLHVPKRDVPGNAQNFVIDVVMFNWFEIAYPVRGDADAGRLAFHAATPGAVEFAYAGAGAPALLGNDGVLRSGTPLSGGRFRAAGAAENVDLYPFTDSMALTPATLRAVAADDLRRADPGYDYLMVAHPRLRAATEALAAYHRAHGLRVAVVDVDDIYDQFSGGIAHPAAIRDYVRWGYEHWQVKPRYLLLVGDASVDIHHDIRNSERVRTTSFAPTAQLQADNLLGQGAGFNGMGTTMYSRWDPELANRNLIPTWQVPSSSQGQSASDNDFVAFKDGDFHPQLAVGRLPVIEPAEVQAIVNKTIAYLTKPAPGRWRHDMTFISSSEVASFKDQSDRLAQALEQRGFAVRSFYTDFNDKDADHVRAIRDALRSNLDAGGLLVHFMGHGGSYIWRVGPMGDLVSLDDVGAMTNAGRYPMVLAMTCFSAPFDNPVDDSIGERFLREADKGAVAVFGASWSNFPDPGYSKDLIERLLQPGARIGDAILAAKAKTSDRTFVEMYNLLGDPALVLDRPQQQLQIEPLGRWDPRLAVAVPAADFGGTVDVDWTDAQGRVLVSRQFEARDRLFYLSPPEGAKQMTVLTTDMRNGSVALGAWHVPDPAPAPAPPPPSASTARASVEPLLPVADRIAASGFEPLPADARATARR